MQTYHSLAAKGEKIDIKAAVAEQEALAAVINGDAPLGDADRSEYTSQPTETATTSGADNSSNRDAAATKPLRTTAPIARPETTGVAALPQTLVNTGNESVIHRPLIVLTCFSVQDQNIQNLMMSWYYAGYYTGLYEGQQNAYAAMQGTE